VTLLREQLDHERSRADRAEACVEQFRTSLQAAQTEACQLRAELHQAQALIEANHQAEAARKGQGRWARIRAAWRGE
jgi:hypothetical protein